MTERTIDGRVDLLNDDAFDVWNKIRGLEHPGFESAYIIENDKKVFLKTSDVIYDLEKNEIKRYGVPIYNK